MAVFSANSFGSAGIWQYNRRPVGLILKFAGVLLSLGAIVLVGTWNYSGFSQGAGGIPVIHPSGNPFKTQPADPGGRKNPYIGREINKLIAGNSNELPENPIYAYAPASVELLKSDLSPRDMQERHGVLIGESRTSASEPSIQGLLAEALASESVEPAESVWVVPKRGRLLIIDGKYADLQEADLVEFKDNRIDHSDVRTGSHVVQLGDFTTDNEAGREWRKLRIVFADLLSESSWFIQEATSGGRQIYRLRVSGFEDRAAAESFCSRMNARQGICIATIMR